MSMVERRRARRHLVLLLLSAFLAGCGGMRAVGEGAWRTGQPTPETIEFAARQLGVRTVVSLRGANPERTSYREEIAACERLGLVHHSLSWSAFGVSDAQIDELVEVFRTSPGGFLIHCYAGRDRTSLAAAIYRLVVLGHDPDAAASELSFVPHGHLPWFGFGAMDDAWARFVARYRAGAADIAGSRRSQSSTQAR
jgi:protein tyrosine phosphatase (PTP) superfamily phosphohydrolase (DUF442 family)